MYSPHWTSITSQSMYVYKYVLYGPGKGVWPNTTRDLGATHLYNRQILYNIVKTNEKIY